jgi:AcrR family transcriptional regulator
MPKLREIRLDQKRQLIEQAALGLFTKQGFNGTNIRDIAEAAGVSTGMIYPYYPSKEALFTSLVHSREAAMSILRVEMFRDLEEPFSAKGLKVLANSNRTIVYDNSDYWRLMYIDVVEFDNRHFAETFHDLPDSFDSGWEGQESTQPAKSDDDDTALGFIHLLSRTGQHDVHDETWNVYGQLTTIGFYKPSFHAAYTNLNGSNSSLKTDAETSFTQTLTLFFGLRLRPGTELYIVPEEISETTLSNLKGLGGATENFELQKVGALTPQAYRSRLFVRQTFGFGGESIELPSGQMQLGERRQPAAGIHRWHPRHAWRFWRRSGTHNGLRT